MCLDFGSALQHTENDTADGFQKTYRNIDFTKGFTNAGLWTTTYDDLTHGNITDSPKMTPQQQRALVVLSNGKENLGAIDWQNAQNMHIIIDKDYGQRTFGTTWGYTEITETEQNWLETKLEEQIYTHLKEEKHKIPITKLKTGENIPIEPGTEGKGAYPAKGYFVIYKKVNENYTMIQKDFDNDNVADAGWAVAGYPFGDINLMTQEFAGMLFQPSDVTYSLLKNKTISHESSNLKELSPGDIKSLNMFENMYAYTDPTKTPIFDYTLPDSTKIQRFYDHTGTLLDDLMKIPENNNES
jgi:hypothetical protein